MSQTADFSELRAQYERHKATFDRTRERWLNEVRKGPDHAERAFAEVAFRDAMADLDLDIDLLCRAFAQGGLPTA